MTREAAQLRTPLALQWERRQVIGKGGRTHISEESETLAAFPKQHRSLIRHHTESRKAPYC